MTFEPQQTIDERYQVISRIGGNTHGSTYKAIVIRDDRQIVLKKLHHDADQGMQQQLHQAQQALQLSSQCDELLTIENVSVEQDSAYYVMPYLANRSLKRRRPPEKNQDSQTGDDQYFVEEFEWLTRTARALDFLSGQNLIHGDVKPANILFAKDDNGQLKSYLSDIEIAKPREQNKGGGMKEEYPGTMNYLAREVFLDHNSASPQSDQYALAVTLYEWLAGEPPFKGLTGIEMYKAFKNGCKPISDLCPELPQPAVDALHRAMSEEPEQRFATSDEFAAAFTESLPVRTTAKARGGWEKAINILLFASAATLMFVIANRFLFTSEATTVTENDNQVETRQPAFSVDKKRLDQQQPTVRPPANGSPTEMIVPGQSPQAVIPNQPTGAMKEQPCPQSQMVNKPTREMSQQYSQNGVGTADSRQSNNAPVYGPVLPPSHPVAKDPRVPQNKIAGQNNNGSLVSGIRNYVPSEVKDKRFSNTQNPAPLQPSGAKLLDSSQTFSELTRRKEEHSFQQYLEAAQTKETSADVKFKLAQMYEQGLGCKQDNEQARVWYEKSANQGSAEAQIWMGRFYERFARNKTAYQWYKEAALQGRPDVSNYLAEFCEKKLRNSQRASQWYKKAAEQKKAMLEQQRRESALNAGQQHFEKERKNYNTK